MGTVTTKWYALVLVIGLSGCGGGGGSGNTSTTQTGSLIDSPVAGLQYTSTPSGLTGTTDGQGHYQYQNGDTVTFSLAGVVLFSTPATGTVTPNSAIGLDATGQINLARFLQTLDMDGYPANGISIDGSKTGAPPSNLNFNDTNFDNVVSAFLTSAQANGAIPSAILVSAATAQAELNTMSSIIGTWEWTDSTGNHPMAFTFLSNGTYLLADDGNTTANDPSGQPGIEVGTYTYDPNSGFLTTTCPSINTDGEWGLSTPNPGQCTGTQATATITGDTMVLTLSGQAYNLTRVVDATNAIVGGWYWNDSTGNHPMAFTFLSNGTYLLADDGNTTANDPSGQPGIEVGTYTYDPNSGFLTTTCPSINTDGEWGLSTPNPGQCTGTQATATITGATMVLTLSGQAYNLTRVVSP